LITINAGSGIPTQAYLLPGARADSSLCHRKRRKVPRAGPWSGDSPNGESLKAVSRTSPRVVSFAPVARCLSSSDNGFGMVSGLNASDAVCLSQTHLLTKRFPLVALQLCFQEMAFFGSFNAASTAKRTLSGRVGFVGNCAHLRIDRFGELQNIVGIGAA